MTELLVLLAALTAGPAPADTTVAVSPGDRLVIEDLRGGVTITSWDRNLVEITDDRSGRIGVSRSGSTVRVGRGQGSGRSSVDAVIRVPRWIDVDVTGTSIDVTARGLEGAIAIRNVSGDVLVEDVSGPVDVRSVSGEVRITDARAAVRASSQSDDVVLRRVSGPVEVHSGDGDIELDGMTSPSVRAEVQDGDVMFNGVLASGGEYGFYVHDGDALIAVPSGTGATVRVSTFDGEFQSEFTVRVERFTAGRQFDFVLGDGGARVEIEVFDGDIHLVRGP